MNEMIQRYRDFLKDTVRLSIDFSRTDQSQGIPPPPIEKPIPPEAEPLDLPKSKRWEDIPALELVTAIRLRRSQRNYTHTPLTLEEISFLLWATQGVSRRLGPGDALRTVPSAGCRHALETYLCILNVRELEPGIYRYLPLEHQLLFEFSEKDLPEKIVDASLGQTFLGRSAAVFIWAAIPYRMEWRYDRAAHKVILIDAGHICQNLYLACEAIGAGTCAVAAYHQEKIDHLLRLDGKNEFVIYLAPVGKV